MFTIKSIEALKPREKLYRVADDGVKGFCIEVAPNGSKRWRFRFRHNGKPGMISLGQYPDVSLSAARGLAIEARQAVARGEFPGTQAFDVEQDIVFDKLALEWVERTKQKQLAAATLDNYRRFREYCFPYIGRMNIKNITPAHIYKMSMELADKKSPGNAHCVLTFVSNVMRYAIPSGRVSADPTIGIRDAIPARPPVVHRYAITNPDEIPELLAWIDTLDIITTRCYMQLMALFWVRASELALARWDEVDWEDKLLRIPAERMKMKRDHLVPLSRQALEILTFLQRISGHTDYLFPGRGLAKNKPMNPRTPTHLIATQFKGRMHIHGFRSMASTLLNEKGWNPDVIEAQLAHQDRNAVRRAYNRAQYLEDRRRMMQEWADYLDELRAKN